MENVLKYENTLQPDDNLMIVVTAANADLVRDFNMMFLYVQSTDMRSVANESPFTYLIDQKGEIDFPVLGKLKLAGMTRIQAEAYIKERVTKYVKNPGVTLRVTNFKVSVIGEVSRPGPQNILGDRITIFEALSGAGDLTIYGKRKDVMVIREKDSVKTITHVDLTNPEIVATPYYYLAHNDVVYVKPNKTRVNSSVVGPNLTLALSTISLLITIITLTTR
ncbi:MAG: polysaccharide biosynthesis/export family protein [Flavobacterium sp.]